MRHEIIKRYNTQKGLDLKSTDLTRAEIYVSSMLNAQYRSSGAAETRKGFQYHSAPAGRFGMHNYKYVDENNNPQEMALSIDEQLYKESQSSVVISYIGAELSVYLSIFFNPQANEYQVSITAGLLPAIVISLGKGYDETSPVTLANLKTAIDSITGFSATITGLTTIPAAFLKIIRNHNLVSDGNFTGSAASWEAIYANVSSPFGGSLANLNSLDFENVSSVNMFNVCYFSNGYDYLLKYDGQSLYRAGILHFTQVRGDGGANISAFPSVGAGLITGSNYMHRAQFVQVDNVGNQTAGNPSTLRGNKSTVASKNFDVQIDNIQTGGFNLNAAIVNGAAAAVNTITVDNGSGGFHTLRVGDTAYFYDAISLVYVERKVTARTSTTITVAGSPVTVADNAVISANLRIRVLRNKTSAITPSVFYIVVELPNNPFALKTFYTDSTIDDDLEDLWEPNASDRSLPPKAKYLSTFQNLLFTAGDPENQTILSWSDIDGPEYFPSDTNKERIGGSGNIITGHGPNGSVFSCFTKRSTNVGSGTFGDGNYRFEEKSLSIGCSAHASISQVEGYTTWWSDRGPYMMSQGQVPQPIGASELGDSRISPVMNQIGYEFNDTSQPLFFRSKRIISINWLPEKKLIFYIPAETVTDGNRRPNTNSRLYVYDYTRDAWLVWDTLNMSGGAILYKDEFYFMGRRADQSGLTVANLSRMHNLNDQWDYEDNDSLIKWEYSPQWEALGQPAVFKKFLEMRIYTIEELDNIVFDILVRQEINYQRDASVAEFSLALDGTGYGMSSYGVESYGDKIPPAIKHELARIKAQSMRLRFINELHQANSVVSGWEILVAAPYREEFKR